MADEAAAYTVFSEIFTNDRIWNIGLSYVSDTLFILYLHAIVQALVFVDKYTTCFFLDIPLEVGDEWFKGNL